MKNFKRLLVTLLTLCLILSSFTVQSFAQTASTNDYFEGELILSVHNTSETYRTTRAANDHTSAIQMQGFVVKDALFGQNNSDSYSAFSTDASQADAIQKMGHVYLVEYGNQYQSFEEAKAALQKNLEAQGMTVKYIEPNYKVRAFGIHPQQEWHYNMINVPEAWQTTTGSSNVQIAVLDTGIDHNHQSLKNLVNTSLGKNFTSGSSTDTMDRQGHGTHCAGTIASYGNVSGVMQSAELIPVKVLGDDGTGSTYGIEQGILYASSVGAEVISMSLGGGNYSQSMQDAVNTAISRGTVVVAATGNDGRGTVSYPAKYSGVIGVGSVTSSRARSSFSNYGSGLDVMAPGSSIYSTYPGNSYKTLSGTSMATPHVAGVVGLIRAANPSLSVQQVESILYSTAQAAGNSNEYGNGIVDAQAAVVKATGGTTPDKVTVEGYAYSNYQKYTQNYWGWTLYRVSAKVFVVLSDGTYHEHGTLSDYSWYGYPTLNQTIQGTALAKDGSQVNYSLQVNIYE